MRHLSLMGVLCLVLLSQFYVDGMEAVDATREACIIHVLRIHWL